VLARAAEIITLAEQALEGPASVKALEQATAQD
jgi:hypothetical protein